MVGDCLLYLRRSVRLPHDRFWILHRKHAIGVNHDILELLLSFCLGIRQVVNGEACNVAKTVPVVSDAKHLGTAVLHDIHLASPDIPMERSVIKARDVRHRVPDIVVVVKLPVIVYQMALGAP